MLQPLTTGSSYVLTLLLVQVDAMLLHMTQSHNLLQTEYALSLLGLQHVGDTLVGDAVLRGVSGGEKRRVAVGEMIVTPANFVVMDEPSTGERGVPEATAGDRGGQAVQRASSHACT